MGARSRLREESNRIFERFGVPGQLTGDGSLFRVLLTREPIVDYRSTLKGALPAAKLGQLHKELLDEGVIISNTGLGCLSTPMGDAEVDAFLGAMEKAVPKLKG